MRIPKHRPPCARCGTYGGRPKSAGGRPLRYSGSRFGIDGHLCASCWQRAHYAHKTRLAGREPGPPRANQGSTAPRCDGCGTLEGYTAKNRDRPIRRRGETWGVAGLFCSACASKLRRSHTKSASQPHAKPVASPAANKATSQTQAQWIAMVAAERVEVPKRTAVVRAAKEEAARRWGRAWLTATELDQILPREERLN